MAIAEELKVAVIAEVQKAIADLKKFERAVDDTAQRTKEMGQKLVDVGKGMTTYLTLPIVGAATASVKFAAEIEKQQTALKVLLGTAEEASRIYEEWQQFSASTPFQLEDITQTGKMLLAFGENAENVTETMRRLGDVAAGIGVPLTELGEIYGKARVQGTLFSEDLNQLAGRGVPIFTELAKVMGTSADQIKKLASEGKVKFGDLEQVFRNLTESGGMFEGMMDELSQTTAGKFSTALDNLKQASAELGAVLLPLVNNILDGVTKWAGAFGGLDEDVKKYIVTMGLLVAGIGPALMAIGTLQKAMVALNIAMAANPVGVVLAAVAAIAALTAGVITFARARRNAQLQELAEEFEDVQSAAGLAVEEIEAIEHALRLGSMDGFMEAKDQVDQLAKNLGVSKLAVIDIGLASETVTEEYKRQLALLRDQVLEQVTMSNYVDSWLVRQKGLEAANARAAEMLRQAEQDRLRLQEEHARRQAAIDDEYKLAYDHIKSILEAAKTESEKIKEQIEYLEGFKWPEGSPWEDARIKAIEILNARLEELKENLDGVKAGFDRLSSGLGGDITEQMRNDPMAAARGLGGETLLRGVYQEIIDETNTFGEDLKQSWDGIGRTLEQTFGEDIVKSWDGLGGTIEEVTKKVEGWVHVMDDGQAVTEMSADEIDNLRKGLVEMAKAANAAKIAALEFATKVVDAFAGQVTGESEGTLIGDIFKSLPVVGPLISALERLFKGIADRLNEFFGLVDDVTLEFDQLDDALQDEIDIRKKYLDSLQDELNTEMDVLRDMWERNLITTDEFLAGMEDINNMADTPPPVNDTGERWREGGQQGGRASGGDVFVNVTGNVYGVDELGVQVHQAMQTAARRGLI